MDEVTQHPTVQIAVVLVSSNHAGCVLVNDVMHVPAQQLPFGKQLDASVATLTHRDTGLDIDLASVCQLLTCNDVSTDGREHTVTILLYGEVIDTGCVAHDPWHWIEWETLQSLPQDVLPSWVRNVRQYLPTFELPVAPVAPAATRAFFIVSDSDAKHPDDRMADLINLGFGEDEALHAWKECNGNLERSIAYLLACQHDEPMQEVSASVMQQQQQQPSPRDVGTKRGREDPSQGEMAAVHEEWSRNKKGAHVAVNDEQMRCYLWQEQFNGGRLTRQQYNFLLAPDTHVPEQMYECSVCYVEYTLDDLAILERCRHHLCASCMSIYLKTEIAGGRGTTLVCPNPECKLPVTVGDVERLAEPDAAQQYQHLLLEDHLQKDPDCRRCPKPDCGLAMIGSKESPMMRCPKETCRYTFCFSCRVQWHADVSCEQYQRWCLENGDAESRFDAWRAKNTKPCPNCARPIEKSSGCNHMTCPAKGGCGAQFCWICAGKYTASHFSQGSCKGKQFT